MCPTLEVDVTQRCNFACRYCYNRQYPQKGHSESRSIDLGVAVYAVDLAWPLMSAGGRVNLTCMGAEPFADFPRLQEIVEYVQSRCQHAGIKFGWGATTNTSLLTDPVVAFIERTGGRVQASLDGCEHCQNFNRPLADGRPSFSLVMGKFPLIKRVSNGLVRATITPQTASYLVENITFLASLGFSGIAAFPATSGMIWEGQHLEALQEQTNLLCRQRRTTLEKVLRLSPFDEYLYFANYPAGDGSHHCGACRGLLAVDINGRFWPCHRFTDSTFSQWEIAGGKELARSAKAVREKLQQSISSRCLSCEAFGPCRGGCWANNLFTTGDVAEPPLVHCQIVKAILAGARQSGIVVPVEPKPRQVPISGELSCILEDVCEVCDCSSGCRRCDTSCDRCHSCEYCNTDACERGCGGEDM